MTDGVAPSYAVTVSMHPGPAQDASLHPGPAAVARPESAPGRRALLGFAGCLVLASLAYLVSIDQVAGLYVDDGWYIVLARALATGQGFTLVNAPIDGVLPFYPPGFPALLALAFLVAPSFPENVWLLKIVSLLALLAGAVLTRHYFLRVRGESAWLASGLALLVVVSPAMHFILTSAVLSEGMFFAVQMAAVVAVERFVRRSSDGAAVIPLLAAAALVAATVLVRSIGVMLLPAAVTYVLLRCGLRRAAFFAAVLVALLAPWQLYAARHAPTAQQRAIVNDPIAWSYLEQFSMKRAGHVEFGRATLAELPARVGANLRNLGRETLGTLYLHPLLERLPRPDRGGFGVVPAISLLLAVLTLLGFVRCARVRVGLAELYVPATFALLLVFAFEADRYLLPLLPFLASYLITGFATAFGAVARLAGTARAFADQRSTAVRAGVLAALLAVNVVGLARDVGDGLGFVPGRRSAWREAFAENLSLLAWVRTKLPRDVVLATHNPGMVHLYTGNPTVGTWEARTNAANWRAARARFWVDNTVAEYRFPNLERSGLAPMVITPKLRLGIYQIPAAGYLVR